MTESLNGAPAVCIAAREGHCDLVSLYLEFGADVNASDDSGLPALSYAARSGHVSVIHLLTIQHAKVLQLVSGISRLPSSVIIDRVARGR